MQGDFQLSTKYLDAVDVVTMLTKRFSFKRRQNLHSSIYSSSLPLKSLQVSLKDIELSLVK